MSKIIKRKKIELLAPAKDKECAIAAINCGADAVYIGYEKFGARSKAGNSLEDIKEVIDYAHKFRAKVYITINTLLTDNQIEDAVLSIQKLYEAGSDAIIIQDMGLLEFDLPPIPIHASTQCHNDSLEKVQFLEKVGLKRAVLARELSLDEISEISENTNIELECFIHGALCVSYSGQCYMSYAIGGRSANRGECAQTCRKKYILIDSEDKIISNEAHLLSLKDFNLSNDIEKLIHAGVTSFKIEGRLKDADYIKNVVGFYNSKINKIISGTEIKRSAQGICSINFEPDLNKTFNRGYTDYFLNGRKSTITSFDSPKSKGEYVGKVKSISSKSFIIEGFKFNNNDGICFLDKDGELKGAQVVAVGNETFPSSMDSIYVGQKIYRNYNQEFSKKLESSASIRKLCVKFRVFESDSSLIFEIKDEDNNTAKVELDNNFEAANNQEAALNNIKKQLLKLGETDFYSEQAEIYIEKLPFIPVSELNLIRRTLCEKLALERQQNYKREEAQIIKNSEPYLEKELYFNSNIINSKAQAFYERHQTAIIETGAETGINMNDKPVMTTKHCLKHSFNLCHKQTSKNNFKEPFYLVDERNKAYRLEFDCNKCVMKLFY